MNQPGSNDIASEIARIANATRFSEAAVTAMADALRAGNGSMAQFGHPELGGVGQWSSGGMLMIGDMFNAQLKARVAALAEEVSLASAAGRLRERLPDGSAEGDRGDWWPQTLRRPSSTGGQNGRRYAVFPQASRLAVENGGVVSIYDTGEHRIGGVSQQQSASSTLRFTSQLGTIDLDDLTKVGRETEAAGHGRDTRSAPADDKAEPATSSAPEDEGQQSAATDRPTPPAPRGGAGNETLDLLRHLADLRNDGILSEDEFAAKKAELLGRL